MSQPAYDPKRLQAGPGQPLIGIPTRNGETEGVRYFTSEEEADRELTRDPDSIARALGLAGAWQELDDEDGPDSLDELDQMRHASKLSRPLYL